jgi:hypothetical protein
LVRCILCVDGSGHPGAVGFGLPGKRDSAAARAKVTARSAESAARGQVGANPACASTAFEGDATSSAESATAHDQAGANPARAGATFESDATRSAESATARDQTCPNEARASAAGAYKSDTTQVNDWSEAVAANCQCCRRWVDGPACGLASIPLCFFITRNQHHSFGLLIHGNPLSELSA